MTSIWQFSFRNGMVLSVITSVLVGCLVYPQVTPDRTNPAVTLTPTLNTPQTFQIPATPSPAPLNLVTAAPTLTNTPTTIPASQISLPYDLLFLSAGRLMRWSHTQNNLRPAVIDVVDYSASQDGSKIAVLRKTGITANAIETFDLTVLNIRSGDFVTLLDSTSRPKAFQISPDGRWIALVNDLQLLTILPSDGSDSGAKISKCQSNQAGDCDDLDWSADSLRIIWDGADGIWQAGPDNLTPSLAISNQLDIADPKGQLTRKQVQFHGLKWSPLGRYVLTRVQPVGSDVSWQAIIDTRQQRMAEITSSYQMDEPTALSSWLNNGNLLVIHRASKAQNKPVTLESWQILPTREDMVSLDFHWEILNDHLVDSRNNKLWSDLPIAAYQVNDRTLSVVFNSAELDGPGELFTFDIKYGILKKISDLPARIVNMSWTPDGNAALLMGSDGTQIYVPADGNDIADVTARIGRLSCCYTWLVDETSWPDLPP